jgi:hypothetical protein
MRGGGGWEVSTSWESTSRWLLAHAASRTRTCPQLCRHAPTSLGFADCFAIFCAALTFGRRENVNCALPRPACTWQSHAQGEGRSVSAFEGFSVSHDEGSGPARENESVNDGDDEGTSLRDTAPGVVPEMELSRTLPTGAAFHATWRIPNLSAASSRDPGQESGIHAVERSSKHSAGLARAGADAPSTMPNTPANSRASDAAKRATTPMKFSLPQAAHPSDDGGAAGDDRASFGTTRREFNQPKLSPREKARRNVLTHTLQMPLVVRPVQPSAANPEEAVERAVRLAATQRQGSQPSPLPGAWTSVHRVGSGTPPEPSSTRPAAARSTDPMVMGRARPESRRHDAHHGHSVHDVRGVHDVRDVHDAHAETIRMQAAVQAVPEASGFARPESVPSASMRDSAGWAQLRTGDYERVTVPGDPVRIPELSGREWLFIALLACASAATLYSLIVDDITLPHEEQTVEAATTFEHLVKPALPNAVLKPGATQLTNTAAQLTNTAAAAATDTTEIVSEPSSAEIVVGGAVIGNTPARVVRGSSEADYLLRKQGYEPQLVRITPHSPKSITITLHPK